MKVTKLNESFSKLEDCNIDEIYNFLKCERADAYFDPLVKRGFKSPYDFFSKKDGNSLIVMNGHLPLLKRFDVDYKTKGFDESELDLYLKSIKLPFTPHDFQIKAFKETLMKSVMLARMCTSSGKSLTISLICDFLTKKGLKGLLLVPNINLLTQFKNDIKSYLLDDLYNSTDTLGGNSKTDFTSKLLISTWQSLMNVEIPKYDFVICDECLHPNSMIKTINGDVRIKDLKKGDLVLTLNETTKELEYKEVVEIHHNLSKNEQMYRLTTNKGELLITGNHKVMTQRGWVRIDELKDDDLLFNNLEYRLEKIDYNQDVYNLHIKDNHNYFANNILVKNCHRFSSSETSKIVQKLTHAKIKLGFTGTLPEDQSSKMLLFGLFGLPKTFIRACELIDRGLGTPITINTIIFDYNLEFKHLLRQSKVYSQTLKMIKECEARNSIIVNLSTKLFKINSNTLILFSHTEHGKLLYTEIMKMLYPNVKIENKDITGKKSFEFQKQYNIYFVNGEDDAKTRELTRQVLEVDHFRITFEDDSSLLVSDSSLKIGDVYNDKVIKDIHLEGAILVSNYQLLSTGVNIRKLHNMILASPLKSYTTITQSIGRGMRLHHSKKMFNVFDLVDNLGIKKFSGVFYKQYQHRLATSYNSEGYKVKENVINI